MSGDELKRRRKALGMTLAELADQMGTTAASVSRWESGQRPIPKMAELLLDYIERDINPPRRATGDRGKKDRK